jgi:hypothetical protein
MVHPDLALEHYKHTNLGLLALLHIEYELSRFVGMARCR